VVCHKGLELIYLPIFERYASGRVGQQILGLRKFCPQVVVFRLQIPALGFVLLGVRSGLANLR